MHTMKLNYKYPSKYDQHMAVSIPIVDKNFDENYTFYRNDFLFGIGRAIAYFVAYTVGYFLCYTQNGIRYAGRKNLKKYKSQLENGCITICNHVFHYDYMSIMIGIRPHREFFPAWSSKFLDKDRLAVQLAGGIPVPRKIAALKKFYYALEQHMKDGTWLHFFPEAAMWPYYQKIRPFKKGAFALADKYNVPILPLAFQFRDPSKVAILFGAKEPRATLYFGEPIFSNFDISDRSERIDDFRLRCFRAVEKLANIPASQSLVPESEMK